jgi:N-acetylglutamate synthase-like GNAT family acetyltransferase
MATRTATPDDLPRIAELLAELRGREVSVSSIEAQFTHFNDDVRTSVVDRFCCSPR